MPFPRPGQQQAAPQQPAPQAPARTGFGARPAVNPSPAAAAAPARTGFGGRPAAAPLAPPAPRSPFAGIESAQARQGQGESLRDGNYVLKLKDVFPKNFRSGGGAVLVEALVSTSSFTIEDSSTHDCNKEGDDVTIFINYGDSFLSNYKGFAIAASGFDDQGNQIPDAEVTEEYCNSLLSNEQAPSSLIGSFVYVEARTKPQKRDQNKSFTYIDFYPIRMNADGTPDLTSI